MIYIFSTASVYSLVKNWKKLLEQKRNLVLYLILTGMGLGLGVIYLMNPFLPSISMYIEKYIK